MYLKSVSRYVHLSGLLLNEYDIILKYSFWKIYLKFEIHYKCKFNTIKLSTLLFHSTEKN